MKNRSNREIGAYCRSLAVILGGGITCEEAVSAMCEIKDESLGGVAAAVRDHFEFSLRDALEKAGRFPDYMVKMVGAGENAGKLEEVLDRLAEYFERMDSVENRVKSAVVYPAVAMLVLSLMLLVMAVKVLPMFSQVYSSLSGQTENFYIGFSSAAAWVVFAMAALLTLLIGVFALMWKSERFKGQAEKILRRTPFFSSCAAEVDLARFTSVYSIYVAGASDTEEAFSEALTTVADQKLRAKLGACAEKIARGTGFSRAAYEEGVFAPVYARVLLSSETSGRESGGLEYIAGKEWELAGEKLDKAAGAVEPVLSATVTVAVGFLLISAMLPLIGIMSSIG